MSSVHQLHKAHTAAGASTTQGTTESDRKRLKLVDCGKRHFIAAAWIAIYSDKFARLDANAITVIGGGLAAS